MSFRQIVAMLAGLGLVGGLFVLYAVRTSSTPDEPPKHTAGPAVEIPLGSILMLSGDYRSLGELVRDGQMVAIGDLNARSGSKYKYRLVVEDSRGDKEIAAEKLRALKKKGVSFVAELMGTDLALHSMKVVEQQQMLLISGLNTGPQLSAGAGRHFFRIIPSDEVAVQNLVRWAAELKLTRAAVVYRNDLWGQGLKGAFAAAFPRQAGTVALEVEVSENPETVRDMAQAIKKAHSDVVMLFVRPAEAGLLVAVCAQLGVKTRFMGTDTLTGAEIHSTGGVAVEGVTYVVPRAHPSEKASHFRKLFADYRRRMGHAPSDEPPLYALMGYDAVHVLAQGIEAGDAKLEPTIRALESLEYGGASGPVAFSKTHDLKVTHPYARYEYVKVGTKIEAREVPAAKPAPETGP